MLELRLLDTPHALHGDPGGVRRLELLPGKPAALLLYLAVRGGWVERGVLADLLAPELDEEHARHNLRLTLSRALKLPWAGGVEAERTRLRFQVGSDVQHLEQAARSGDFGRVLTIYRQPLLAGFSLDSVPALAAWAQEERARLEGLFLEALSGRAAEQSAAGHHREGLALLEQRLERDPLAEQSLQAALSLCLTLQERERGLGLYTRFEAALHREAQVRPLPSTVALLGAVRAGGGAAVAGAAVSATTENSAAQAAGFPEALRHSPYLAGRETEQARLRHGLPGLVILSGAAGVGKSHLLQGVLPQAHVLHCREGLSGVPYHPLVAAIRTRFLGQPEDVNPEHRPAPPELGAYAEDLARVLPELYPALHPPPLEPNSARLRLLEAFARALVDDPAGGTLILDDAQWADPTTLEWLTYVRSRRGLALVIAYRPEEHHAALGRVLAELRPGATELRLEPLDASALGEWLRTLMGRHTQGDEGVPRQFAAWLHRHSGGHPLYVLETLRSLFESGVLHEDGHDWHTDLDARTRDSSELDPPPRLRQLVVQRLERLPQGVQRLLGAASVLGEWQPRMLGELLGLSELEVLDASESAEAAALLSGTQFAHGLLRQAVYASLSPARRRYLHAGAARWLAQHAPEADTTPPLLAHHWERAGEPERGWPARLRHGEHLRRRGQYTAAILQWKTLLAALPGGHPLALETRVRLGRLLLWENMDAGQTHLERALEQLNAPGTPGHPEEGTGLLSPELLRLDTALGLSELALYRGDNRQAQGWLDTALNYASGQHLPEDLSRSLTEQQIETGFRCGQYSQVRRLIAAHATPWPLLRVYAAYLDFYAGRYRRAVQGLETLLSAVPELAHAVTLEADLALCHIYLGDLEAARQALAGSFERSANNPHALTISHSNLGLLELYAGRLEEAQVQLAQAERMARELGSQTYLADVLHRRAGPHFARGDLGAALALLEEAYALMETVGDPYRLLYIGGVWASLLAYQGQTDSAQVLLLGGRAHLNADTPLLARLFHHRAWAVVLLMQGQPERARAHNQADLRLARYAGLHFEEGHAVQIGTQVAEALKQTPLTESRV
ncbi:ATP-binding protein [Deinococcus altitudinis]|uniref:ATP-binding protein n=1 Tax=Deinococcus altitudinis TaxID=468914 RepID=UPI003892371B